ncbi:MAG: TonB-dependent receptor, partial [Bacteroidales bacterium]|nr:TonB-dependent receptor [Bacteroidales bacterium]
MKKTAFILLMQLQLVFAYSQNINGYVGSESGEKLAGATVNIINTTKGTITDKNGFFEIKNLNSGEYELLVSFLGYEKFVKRLNINNLDVNLTISLKTLANITEEVIISAIRAGENVPVASTIIKKDELEKNNIGQEIPYLLSLTPSIVVSSDAGAGVGYSKFSIRGTDMTRINVTTNGIPLNDSESHGVWWVNMPDLAASVENIQIQRGVGSSTNGPAAFGANINFQTNVINKQAYAQLNSSYGTFNTYKGSVKVGSGLINEHFSMDLRLSKIHSDGFIDRASSDLSSFAVSTGYSDKKTLLKFIILSGNEETYQAWNGVPKVRLENDMDGMQRYQDHYLYSEEETLQMLNSNNRTYNYYTYDNEVDNYSQNHYQLIFSREILDNLNLNLAFNYTKGEGYYEQYKKNQNLADYNMQNAVTENDIISETDLIRRKILDNDFYALSYSSNYQNKNFKATLGGSYSIYEGKHFGNVIWARFSGPSEIRHQWYYNLGDKKGFNVFTKFEYEMFNKLNLYADFQYRTINYKIDGIDDDLTDISQIHNYDFLNPKFGASLNLTDVQNVYFSVGIASREPSRTDLKDAVNGKMPVQESLIDYELGYTLTSEKSKINFNLYFMDYNNQLVQTGKINDVGNAIMTNIPKSYRAGIEVSAGIKFLERVDWQINTTISRNRISSFTSYVDNWDDGGQNEIYLGETNLSFSPEIIAGSNLSVEIIKNLNIALISKFVDKQYIDNTSNENRMLDAYFVNNIKLDYSIETKIIK